jgi:hypothetical protein
MERSDLTGFAALLGESLSSRVDLLERLLRGAHYPSLGQYKERLLADTIRNFLPGSVEVGTGFVLFPHTDEDRADSEFYDPLNQSAYSVSRQCDLLIYDLARYPPIFRDRDFVVVRPEAVRAVIEVKGSISTPELRSALASFHDFGLKWRTTQQFYIDHHQTTTPTPGMHIVAWDRQRRKGGRAIVTPKRLAAEVASFYQKNVSIESADGYPFLDQLLIYNECEISAVHGFVGADTIEDAAKLTAEPEFTFGWQTLDGRFTRIDGSGELYRDRDRTIASLLASLHINVGTDDDFNRFFSYTDEVRYRGLPAYEFAGVDWAYTSLKDGQPRQFTAKIPRSGAEASRKAARD